MDASPVGRVESVSVGDVVNTVIDGLTYDAVKYLVGPALVTVAASIVMTTVLKKLTAWKEFITFVAWTFVAVATLFYLIGSTTPRPRFAGGIRNVVVLDTGNTHNSAVLITVSILNTGTMQSITKGWSVTVSKNGVIYHGFELPLTHDIPVEVPAHGDVYPMSMTYHADDNMLTKSVVPVPSGAGVAGILYVGFADLDVSFFKSDVDVTVTYEDVFSTKYTSTLRMTASFGTVTVVPGLHTDMVCRFPAGQIPLTISPLVASPPTPAPPK